MSSVTLNPLLVPGSRWALTRKNTISVSTVLCVTNLQLREELQREHPPVVVVLTETNKVLHHSLDAFLARREFVGNDDHVAESWATLITPPDDEDDTEEDIDEQKVNADAAFEALLGSMKASTEDEDADANQDAGEPDAPVFFPEQHDGLDLGAHFVSYSEAPGANGHGVQMTLRFSLNAALNIDQVRALFEPTPEGSLALGLEHFVVDSFVERIEVNSWYYKGTYLEVDVSGDGYAVVYLSAGDKHEEVIPVTEEKLTEIPQVSVTSAVTPETEANNTAVNVAVVTSAG